MTERERYDEYFKRHGCYDYVLTMPEDCVEGLRLNEPHVFLGVESCCGRMTFDGPARIAMSLLDHLTTLEGLQ